MVRVARALGWQIHPKFAGLVAYGSSYPGAYLLGRGLFLPAEIGDIINDEKVVQQGLTRLSPLFHTQKVLTPQPRTAFGKVAVLESCMYLRNQLLRDSDWAGMAHSLEVRTPLVDYTLLRKVAPIMVKKRRPSGKILLAQAPTLRLPIEIVNRPKSGFSIPIRSWFRAVIDQNASGKGVKVDERLWNRTWAREIFARARQSIQSSLQVES